MRGAAIRFRRMLRRLRRPPIGFQHGPRARFIKTFPFICWTYYYLVAHTTPRLYLMGVAGLGPLVIYTLLGFENRALFLAYAALAWIAVSIVAAFVLRPRLEVQMHLPPRTERGTLFETRYTVRNLGRWAVRDLAVDTIIFSDWMSLQRGRAHLAVLPPGATETIGATGVGLTRGVFTLPALRYDATFPCGFWRWGRTDMRTERVLSVYPRYTRLAELDIPLGPRNRQELSAARELSREALEFHGCREFRDGDALRHVHPRSSARLGVPVVKEFQAEGLSRTALLVDTRERGSHWRRPFSRLRHESAPEAALSLAAAITEALSRTDRVLELLVAGEQVYRFVSRGRSAYLEEALDLLAAVETTRDDRLGGIAPLLLDEIHEIQSICLLLTAWDEPRASLVDSLRSVGVGLKIVVITPRRKGLAGLPPDALCVTPSAVFRGEVLSL